MELGRRRLKDLSINSKHKSSSHFFYSCLALDVCVRVKQLRWYSVVSMAIRLWGTFGARLPALRQFSTVAGPSAATGDHGGSLPSCLLGSCHACKDYPISIVSQLESQARPSATTSLACSQNTPQFWFGSRE